MALMKGLMDPILNTCNSITHHARVLPETPPNPPSHVQNPPGSVSYSVLVDKSKTESHTFRNTNWKDGMRARARARES